MSFRELQTDRLSLIEIKEHNSQRLYEIFSMEEVTRYYGMERFTSIENAVNLIHSFQKMFNEKRAVRWGMVVKHTGTLIGTIGLNNLQIGNRRTEIGYEIHPEFWRKGYAAEAISGVLKYTFEDLDVHRVGAVTFPENKASANLLRKLSFKEEGLLRGYIHQGGQSHDACVFSLLKPEWQHQTEYNEKKVNLAN